MARYVNSGFRVASDAVFDDCSLWTTNQSKQVHGVGAKPEESEHEG